MHLFKASIVTLLFIALSAFAVKFSNVALHNDLSSFIHHPHRTATEGYEPVKAAPGAPYPFASRPQFPGEEDLPYAPVKGYGRNGAILIDFDGDGDLDIYLTDAYQNDNKLFINLLKECGSMQFDDITSEMGDVGLNDHDSAALCFGDMNNDGLDDIVVMGHDSNEESGIRLLQGVKRSRKGKKMRKGNCRYTLYSTFSDVSERSGVKTPGFESYTPSGCTVADFDGDGKLDIYASTLWFNMSDGSLIFNDVQSRLTHNMLSMQSSSPLVFTEEAGPLGLQNQELKGITWAVGAADFDGDGDVDIFASEDQGAMFATTVSQEFGLDRGYLRVFKNRLVEDGELSFQDITLDMGIPPADYMSVSFGDLNCDTKTDIFYSLFGDYGQVDNIPAFAPYTQPAETSRWRYFDGTTFKDSWESTPRIGGVISTPFGWGSTLVDYDNDADMDIIFNGGIHVGRFIDFSPGAVLENQGCRSGQDSFNTLFERDVGAYSTVENGGNPFTSEMINCVISGDLDNDGFNDLLLTSSFAAPPEAPYSLYTADLNIGNGSPQFPVSDYTGSSFNDDYGKWINWEVVDPTDPDPQDFTWKGIDEIPEGRVFLLKNDGDVPHKGRSVRVTAVGTIGIVPSGCVNRNGIGAVVVVKPRKNQYELANFAYSKPIVGGSGFAGQDGLAKTLGIKNAKYTNIEIRWPSPNGVLTNELKCVEHGEDIIFPEIPCDITHNRCPYGSPLEGFYSFRSCILNNINSLRRSKVLGGKEASLFYKRMCNAFLERHGIHRNWLCPSINCN